MKITKFPQSCVLVECKGTKILVDPTELKFEEKFMDLWKDADAVLVTHKHSDHFSEKLLTRLAKPIYSTSEVQKVAPSLKMNIIKAGDDLKIGKIKVEVTKAIHGFVMAKGEIKENVGFIIDDGKTRLWITSDTIRFKNNYKADIVMANVTAFDASMNLWGAAQLVNEAEAKLLIVAHQDTGKVMYKGEEIESYLKEQKVNYIIPETMRTLEIHIKHS